MSGKQRSEPDRAATAIDAADAAGTHTIGMRLSMHDGVDASCDCCSCEAEPYWIEAMAKRPGPEDQEG